MSKKKRNKAIMTAQMARQPTTRATGSVRQRIINLGYSEHAANHRKGSMAGWNPIASSPAADINSNLFDLYSRSRDLAMGNAISTSGLHTSRTNVIGSGLKARPRVDRDLLGLDKDTAAAWEKKAAKEFSLWADSPSCDLHNCNNFYDLQDINYLGYMTNGDSFALLKYRGASPGNPYHLKIQLLEADRITNPDSSYYTGSTLNVIAKNPANGNRIISGVEIDQDGAIVAYWISNRYLYDPTNYDVTKWVRVDVANPGTGLPNILQTAHFEREEQYRGVPYLAPVIGNLKQVGRYTEAELTTAILRSFLSLFFTQQVGAGGALDFPIGDTYSGTPEAEDDIEPAEFLNTFKLGPGTLNMLPPGYDVKTVASTSNMANYDIFVNNLIKQIGASLEIPYEVLMKCFSSSYTAARGALLQAWAAFKMRRDWFTRDFCQPIYEAWLVEAVFLGRLDAPGFFDDPLIRKAWSKALWYGPTIGVLDPVKEAQGAEKRINLGLSTREKECMELTGTEIEDNLEQLAREEAMITGLNVTVNGVAKRQKGVKNP